MNALHQEIVNFAQFLEAILLVGFYTGLPVSLAIFFMYESAMKRRI